MREATIPSDHKNAWRRASGIAALGEMIKQPPPVRAAPNLALDAAAAAFWTMPEEGGDDDGGEREGAQVGKQAHAPADKQSMMAALKEEVDNAIEAIESKFKDESLDDSAVQPD